ncbi:MAG: HAMP domain-containing sensor histidine kinase [bacterium]|nr:HAMP domain-containing sensor histidine kinase [bacterium]
MEQTHKYRLRGSLAAKIIAMILLICSCFSTLFSGLGILFLESHDIYIKSQDTVQKEYFDAILSKYSIGAVTGEANKYRYDELKDTNFRYGVIRTTDFDQVDISDRNSYVFNNFDERFDVLSKNAENLHLYSCNYNSTTDYEYNDTLFGNAYIYNHSMQMEEIQVPISGAFYDWQTKQFYLSDGKYLYHFDGPVEVASFEDGEEYTLRNLEDIIYLSNTENDEHAQGEKHFGWTLPAETIVMIDSGRYQMLLDELQIVGTAQLSEVADLSEGIFEALRIEDTGFMCTNNWMEEEKPQDQYYVLSYVAEPIVMGKTFASSDLFAQAKYLITIAYQWRYVLVGFLIVSLAIAIASFSFLCAAAGRRKDSEELVGHIWDKLPPDVFFVGVAAIDACLLMLTGAITYEYTFRSFADFRHVWTWLVCGICGTICIIITQGWFMSLSYHIQQKNALKSTFIYRIFKWVRNLWRKLVGAVHEVMTNLSVYQYSILMLVIFAVVQFFMIVLSSQDAGIGVLIWMIEIAVVLVLGVKLTKHLHMLSDGAKRLSEGELDHRVNTEKMLAPLKKHGERLNAIGDGMNAAVDQKMKSERFKTELITNVSHDIKTPLTSIINYVDLLGKEKLDNEKAKEYLEVLARQSAKLKKLIEDLIEASKASTGNLSVNVADLDASVVMAQVVGEFEEKLLANKIELLVQTPEEPVRINADGRHLWRVFDNLLNNICKYAMPGTRAYVNVEKISDSSAKIVFKNISRDALNISSEELMERFVRADSSRHTEGNGLGLSIAKSLMELMGGELKLTVDGDLFKVELSFGDGVYGPK